MGNQRGWETLKSRVDPRKMLRSPRNRREVIPVNNTPPSAKNLRSLAIRALRVKDTKTSEVPSTAVKMMLFKRVSWSIKIINKASDMSAVFIPGINAGDHVDKGSHRDA